MDWNEVPVIREGFIGEEMEEGKTDNLSKDVGGKQRRKRTPGLKSELLTLVEQTPGLLIALALGCFGFYNICGIYHLLKNVQFVTISLLILKKCSLLDLILYLSFCILYKLLVAQTWIFSSKDQSSCNRFNNKRVSSLPSSWTQEQFW